MAVSFFVFPFLLPPLFFFCSVVNSVNAAKDEAGSHSVRQHDSVQLYLSPHSDTTQPFFVWYSAWAIKKMCTYRACETKMSNTRDWIVLDEKFIKRTRYYIKIVNDGNEKHIFQKFTDTTNFNQNVLAGLNRRSIKSGWINPQRQHQLVLWWIFSFLVCKVDWVGGIPVGSNDGHEFPVPQNL